MSHDQKRPVAALSGRTYVVFLLALLGYLLSSGFGHTGYNNYVLLADAWLHGRVWIDQPAPAIDALKYAGHFYILEPPMPAVLLLPLVAIVGQTANQSFVCIVCGAVAVAAIDVLLGRMAVPSNLRIWIVVFFAAGTVLWWCTAFGAVWMYAHVAGAMFALLVLAEWYGARRPWLLGLLLACAALSRFPIVLAAPPFAVWLWLETMSAHRVRALASLAAGMAPLFALQLAYNWVRWHTLADIGYITWYHQDQIGEPTGSPFRLQYLPFNLFSFFLLGPDYVKEFPWIKPTGFGISLTLTSPALALAFLAPLRNRETIILWSAALLAAIPSLLYYVNGYEQFGMRHSLDFTPFLVPLVARGLTRRPEYLCFGLIVYSVLANAYGLWYSWAYHAYSVVPM